MGGGLSLLARALELTDGCWKEDGTHNMQCSSEELEGGELEDGDESSSDGVSGNEGNAAMKVKAARWKECDSS